MNTLVLYNHAVSTCSQKVLLCLHEKGLAFDARQVDLRAKENLSPGYLKLNPNGVVPTLVHDGVPVVDSSVIMEYLDEVFDAIPLMPASAQGRARVRAWLRYLEEVPTVAVRYPSYNQAFVPANFSRQTEEQFNATAKERPLRQHFYERMGRNGFNDTDIRASLEALQGTVRRVDAALSDGGLGSTAMHSRWPTPVCCRWRIGSRILDWTGCGLTLRIWRAGTHGGDSALPMR